ncbi:transposable element Tcb2 transposase [Trichonephila clavipes]|nr:transposable element Tcb2 transposase [Trichonephila clavipes]
MMIFHGLPLVFWLIMMNPGCQSSGSRAQMDTQPTRLLLHGQNEEMDKRLNKCLAVRGDYGGFNLSSDDNRVRVWKPLGEYLYPAFAVQRHTAPTAGGIVWDVMAYDTRSPLILIDSTTATKWYVHDILQPHLLPLIAGFRKVIFQQDNARPHTARMSQN